MSTSLLVVGVCSFLFHATLRHGPQFSDDISMLFLAGALLQRLCVGGRQAPAKARTITAAIYACVGTMSAFYVASGNLLVHLAMFVGMLLLIGLRTAYLITREEVSAVDRGKYWRTFGRVCASLALGFVLWNIDLKWCHELRSVRSAIGLPWAWLLELHGWWHVLTAVGGALHMNLARELCT
jgi:dihydroceramidase